MALIQPLTQDEAERQVAQWAQQGIAWLQEGARLGVFATENITQAANDGGRLTTVAGTPTVPWPADTLARAQANYGIAQAVGNWGRTVISGGKTPLQWLQGMVRSGGVR